LASGASSPDSSQDNDTKQSQRSFTRLDITVASADGQSFAGEVEEPLGTELPIVDVDEPAAVWVHMAGSIIVTANGVFES
jgi:hypothetical protein